MEVFLFLLKNFLEFLGKLFLSLGVVSKAISFLYLD